MTASTPEPTNVGPIAGGNIRASDADREQVMTVLNTAFAEGRLSRDEHDDRVSQVMAARTFDDLVPVTHDLVVVAPQRPVAPVNQSDFAVDTRSAHAAPDWLVAIFGAVNRTGRWRVRKRSQALAVFGGMDLDLRNAVFEDPVVEVSGFWCFGGMEVKVPAGIEVRDQVIGIFGGSDVRDLGEPQPGAPTLVVKGLALFGGVSIRGPKSEKPAHKKWH